MPETTTAAPTEGTVRCPGCGLPLIRVEQSATSPLNKYQFEAGKAGDWFCATCPSNDRGNSAFRYFWASELAGRRTGNLTVDEVRAIDEENVDAAIDRDNDNDGATAAPTEGGSLRALWDSQAQWSQATFGTDGERGPQGPLKHLAREVVECLEAPFDCLEYADCLLLLMDAARRAGFTLNELVACAKFKHGVNRRRTWPKPTSATEPVMHLKDGS
jgi:hypothetical protein